MPELPLNAAPPGTDSIAQRDRRVSFEREPGVTAIRVEPGVALVSLRFLEAIPQNRLVVLEALAHARVPVNQVKLHPEGLSFVIGENYAKACEVLLEGENRVVDIRSGMALVSTVAGAMRDLSGVIARICEALLKVGILHRQTGDAYDSVLFLVPASDAPVAVAALRQAFGLSEGGA